MMTVPSVVVNGKFLGAGPTGVHRVAHELLRAVDADSGPRPSIEALVPPADVLPSAPASIPVRAVGRLSGVAWEQIDLPRAAHGRLILSLCNLAPMVPHNAITMIHDAQVFAAPESYRRGFLAWYRLNLRMAGWRHRRILTVSHFSKAQLVQYGVAPAERIDVIHNGVDHVLRAAADYSAMARLELRRHGYAVALANVQKHKNIGLLLDTFSRPEMAGLKLVLVGHATRQDFEGSGMTVPDNVVFAGAVSDTVLRGLIEEALCLAFPSRTEGFGLPPVEAMLLGCPAVIAPCGALPEVCGSAALTADPDDRTAWTKAILDLAADGSEWIARSAAGRSHAREFTWARAGRQLINILDDVGVRDRR